VPSRYVSHTQKRRKDGLLQMRRMLVAFACHLLDVARDYPGRHIPKGMNASEGPARLAKLGQLHSVSILRLYTPSLSA